MMKMLMIIMASINDDNDDNDVNRQRTGIDTMMMETIMMMTMMTMMTIGREQVLTLVARLGATRFCSEPTQPTHLSPIYLLLSSSSSLSSSYSLSS